MSTRAERPVTRLTQQPDEYEIYRDLETKLPPSHALTHRFQHLVNDTGPPPVVVCVAPNGARRTKANHPQIPLTAAELARDALECVGTGATVMHLHVRDAGSEHSLDAELYREAIASIRSRLATE